jgi:hypothetical protein
VDNFVGKLGEVAVNPPPVSLFLTLPKSRTNNIPFKNSYLCECKILFRILVTKLTKSVVLCTSQALSRKFSA